MATDFNKNVSISTGSFKPATADTPLDIRTRVETEADIKNIPTPFIGMVVYVKDTGKRFEVLSLKDKKVGMTTLVNGVVNEYRELPYAFKDVVEEALELKANKEDVDEELALKANKTELEGLATEEFVRNKIAEAQLEGEEVDLSGLATKEELALKADKSELFSGNYEDLENKPEIPSIEGLASEEFVQGEIAKIVIPEVPAIDHLATKEELQQAIEGIDFPEYDDAELRGLIEGKADKSEIPSIEGLASEEFVQQEIAKIPEVDLDPYAKKEDLFNKDYNELINKPEIPSIEGLATEEFVNQQIEAIEFPEGYDDTEIRNLIDGKADKSELFSGDYNDLENKPVIPSMEGLASEEFVNNAIEAIPEVDLDPYAKKEDLFSGSYNDLVDKPEIPSIDGLATETYVDGKIDEVAENDIFKADMKTVSTLGGIAAGSDLNGMTIQEVLTKLLYPYVKPTVSASITYNPTGGVYEFGQTVNVTKIGATIGKKSEVITSIKFYMNGSVVEELTEGVANGGSFAHTFDPAQQITKTIANSYFKVVATDASGQTVTGNTSALNFYYPYYYGVVNDGVAIDQDIVKGLTKDVSAKGQKAYTFTSDNQRMVIAYPKSYGALKSILDPNGFEQLGTFTRTEVSVTGLDGTAQTYYVYANGANTNTNFKMTFKY